MNIIYLVILCQINTAPQCKRNREPDCNQKMKRQCLLIPHPVNHYPDVVQKARQYKRRTDIKAHKSWQSDSIFFER